MTKFSRWLAVIGVPVTILLTVAAFAIYLETGDIAALALAGVGMAALIVYVFWLKNDIKF